jgi:hypothetical protein
MHFGHYQSTGEGVAIAMPGVILHPGPLDRGEKPPAGALRVGKHAVPLRSGAQLFKCRQSCSIQRNISGISILGPRQVQLPTPEIDLSPGETVLFAHPDSGVNRQQQVRMIAGIGRPEQGAFLFVGQKPHLVVVLRPALDSGRRVARDLLIVDAHAEDQREGRLPAVPARCFPVARLGLLGQPADDVLFGDLIGRPVSEERNDRIDPEVEFVGALGGIFGPRVFERVGTEGAEEDCLPERGQLPAFQLVALADRQQVDGGVAPADLLAVTFALKVKVLNSPDIRAPGLLVNAAQLFSLSCHLATPCFKSYLTGGHGESGASQRLSERGTQGQFEGGLILGNHAVRRVRTQSAADDRRARIFSDPRPESEPARRSAWSANAGLQSDSQRRAR